MYYTHKATGFSCLLLICINFYYVYSESPDSSKNTLQLQQMYIRNLVNEQKKQILNTSEKADYSKELQASKIKEMDSTLLNNLKSYEQKNVSLNDATKVVVNKSSLRKKLIIGGLSSGALAGTLAYFLTSGKSKPDAGESYIDDRPPLHP